MRPKLSAPEASTLKRMKFHSERVGRPYLRATGAAGASGRAGLHPSLRAGAGASTSARAGAGAGAEGAGRGAG
jgi:hypothetical protein